MNTTIMNQKSLLDKLGIKTLNSMQEEALLTIPANNEIVLLSPTGTGKTLAFLLPIIENLDSECKEIQTLIIVPSRELALQIEQVLRTLGTGYKVNAIYGGRAGTKDKIDIKHRPAILIGTPGRIADHIRRENFSVDHIKTLVLDEFDKSLEVGFENELKEIISALHKLNKKVLTSATQEAKIPSFVGLKKPITIDFREESSASTLTIKTILSPTKDKLDALVKSIKHLGSHPGIVFCNFKDTIQEVSDVLSANNISHGCFFGGMEQKDRERALIKFRNGTYQLLVATDLAARGIDVPEIKYILHYQLPPHEHEFTHRNGRTARMFSDGTAYIIKHKLDKLPDYIGTMEQEVIKDAPAPAPSQWRTLFISGGKKDKISKSDIMGLCCKQGNLDRSDIGLIEVKLDCAFISIKFDKVGQLIQKTNNTRLKKKKVRITTI